MWLELGSSKFLENFGMVKSKDKANFVNGKEGRKITPGNKEKREKHHFKQKRVKWT